ncbi:hypothetical protein FDQ87_02385 [Salmonella enterica]|uniref:Matrin-type domain-containing protein n=5 Tax=Salmonella enterica TaxID=28901 RepID=A0A3V9YRT7_SALMO|nr:hypothetical protein [Salmonella enterica]EAB7657649.1 hypothetical protein [Salmonella enterica subsp. enterica serovar Oslo]EBE2583117.1 hypothetical protein [Salmonella enterica subsp. enterica serovar 4,[5],12:i:-]EBK1855194.1 hypothetical protein [Salmonella enterica subsp. enterica serovar Give]EBU8855782.1 hypothetical protein [Salmonella enterica subsp. enterica serovar Braenderup]EDD0346973.1 hypothetical protein [Salmonella enterica subsp. enterica serovar Enteritidis]EDD0561929.
MALKRDKFDDVFSQLVRERTDWICDYCGRTFHHERQKLHCSHFKSRRHKATRYHPYNAFAHCIGCHRKLEEDPYEFTAHAEIVYGEMTIERVARLACIPVRLNPWQMDELYQHMKSELKRLQELRAHGVTGRIDFTLPDWYQDGIQLRMGESQCAA